MGKSRINGWIVVLIVFLCICAFFFILSFGLFFSVLFSGDSVQEGNVAVIALDGPISVNGIGSYFDASVSSKKVIPLIKKAVEDEKEAIIFEINSPGGSAVASYEIADAIAELEIPTVAVVHEVGASGAYWIAASTDYIIANELSMVGSIGVISSYLDFSGLLDDYNVSYERLVAGEFKDTGSPLKKLSSAERELFQHKLDLIHDVFIEQVAEHRSMSVEEVTVLADGFVYLGLEGAENGLVDTLGGMNEAEDYLESELGVDVETVQYKEAGSFLSLFSEVMSKHGFSVGLGLSSGMEVDNSLSVLT
jgi:protease IV